MDIIRSIYEDAILPAYALLPAKMNTQAATVQLITIGLQESRLIHQKQIGGPARGLFQFEKGGGVHGVLNHRASKEMAHYVCEQLGVEPTTNAVYLELSTDNDALDAAFARLLLWTDPYALPNLGQSGSAWELYIRTWRPGKPHRHTWDRFYDHAMEFVKNGPV